MTIRATRRHVVRRRFADGTRLREGTSSGEWGWGGGRLTARDKERDRDVPPRVRRGACLQHRRRGPGRGRRIARSAAGGCVGPARASSTAGAPAPVALRAASLLRRAPLPSTPVNGVPSAHVIGPGRTGPFIGDVEAGSQGRRGRREEGAQGGPGQTQTQTRTSRSALSFSAATTTPVMTGNARRFLNSNPVCGGTIGALGTTAIGAADVQAKHIPLLLRSRT